MPSPHSPAIARARAVDSEAPPTTPTTPTTAPAPTTLFVPLPPRRSAGGEAFRGRPSTAPPHGASCAPSDCARLLQSALDLSPRASPVNAAKALTTRSWVRVPKRLKPNRLWRACVCVCAVCMFIITDILGRVSVRADPASTRASKKPDKRPPPATGTKHGRPCCSTNSVHDAADNSSVHFQMHLATSRMMLHKF